MANLKLKDFDDDILSRASNYAGVRGATLTQIFESAVRKDLDNVSSTRP